MGQTVCRRILISIVLVLSGILGLSCNPGRKLAGGEAQINFGDMQIQRFRVSENGHWLMVAAVDRSSEAILFTRHIEDAQMLFLPMLPGPPPIHFEVSIDGRRLDIEHPDGSVTSFYREEKEDEWHLTKTANDLHSRSRIWHNFSLPSHHGIQIEGEPQPAWFPSLLDFDRNQRIVYAEQAKAQGPIVFLSESPFENYLWLMNANGTNLRKLALVPNVNPTGGLRPFAWVGKGKQLVFEATVDARREIRIIEIATGDTAFLVDNACCPTVSSSGLLLSYRRPLSRESLEIMSMDSMQTVQKIDARWPLGWSPKNDFFVSVRAERKGSEITRFLRSFPFVLEPPDEDYFLKVVDSTGSLVGQMRTEVYASSSPLPDWMLVERWKGNNVQWAASERRMFFLVDLNTIGYVAMER